MKQNFINLLKGTLALGAVILPAFFSSCADENEETVDCATVSEYITFNVKDALAETRIAQTVENQRFTMGGVEPSSSSEQEQDSCCSDTSSSTPDSTLYKTILRAENGDSLFLKVSQSDDFPSVDKEDDSTPLTRGTLVSSISSFGVSASVYSSSQSYTSNPCGNYFYKQQVTAGTPTSYFWPTSAYRLSFYAYYPYGNSAFTVSSSASSNGIPTYAYTVPSSISAQQDVMTAQVTNKACGSPQTPVSLSFNHHTSAIKVKYTNDGASAVTITGISITGVKYSGTLNNGTWTLGSAVNSITSNPFSLSLSTNVAAGATVDLTGTSNIFLMLPQTLPSGAKLVVTTSDNSYECPLSGSWVDGKSYTYHISVEDAYEYHLSVGAPGDFTYAGGTNNYSVLSYKENAGGTKAKVSWTAQFSTDGGSTWSSTKPTWLTTFTTSGGGWIPMAYVINEYDVTVSAQTSSSSTSSASNVLKAATAVSNYDLSLHDVQGNTTTRNTANCYMVHAPGTYKLPLVYGNAIKNGSTNSSAYNPSGTSGTNFLKPFLNHAGSGITNPWLKNNSATPDGATVIWQDVNGLIKNGSLAISGDYLTFEITSDAIAEGNAVIAATKSGTVVWSWHIWVTPEKFSNLTTVATGSHTYTVTPVNLGWVATGNVTTTGYAGREVMVKISQSET